jgi:hypothetical protein
MSNDVPFVAAAAKRNALDQKTARVRTVAIFKDEFIGSVPLNDRI